MMLKKLLYLVSYLVTVVLLSSVVAAQHAFDARTAAAKVEPSTVFSEFPITVECRVKLEKSNQYSVIIANETKKSSTHWEIFTSPNDGLLSFYAPGFDPDHLHSYINISDNRWHHVAAVIEKESVSLYIDGKRRGNSRVAPSSTPTRVPGPLVIGALAEGGYFCQGEISEVRISRGVLEINPDKPMMAEESTLGFWQFENDSDGIYKDLSGNNRPAALKKSRIVTKADAAAKEGTAYLCSTHQGERLLILDDTGNIRWEYQCNHPQDVWMLDNGNILVAWYYAVQEIKPDMSSGKGGEVVWEYKTQAPNEIPCCQPLPDGNVMIGIVGECRLIEVDRSGKIVHEIKLATTEKNPHSQFRLCRKTLEGTYIVPFTAEGIVREYDAAGKIVREFPKCSAPVGVERLPDGNTLLTGSGRVTEYDGNNRVVWELTHEDVPGINIGIFAGIERLPNGNTIICNWNSQPSGDKSGVHILEVTRNKRVVWQVESLDFGQVAACRLLTPDFKPKKAFANEAKIEAGETYHLIPGGVTIGTSDTPRHMIEPFNGILGDRFTISFVMETAQKTSAAVLFAKDNKINGHYEVWMHNGYLAFYAPEINRNSTIYTNVNIADGKRHHVAITYNLDLMRFYVDNVLVGSTYTSGSITSTAGKQFNIGALVDGSFAYEGFLRDIQLIPRVLSRQEREALLPNDVVAGKVSEDSISKVSTYTPKKYQPTKALRGTARLLYPQALPLVDFGARVGYQGSIARDGSNADWDWYHYQDNNGEYVLFEASGSGTIYNFTQHRYPSSQIPTFKFYFDSEITPSFTVTPREFGEKFPYAHPLSGKYVGPYDNANPLRQIWVVRNFTPLSFAKYCKVTSDIKLEGNEPPGGGWGHVTYALYQTADEITTYNGTQTNDDKDLEKLAGNLTFDPKYNKENVINNKKNVTIPAGGSITVYDKSGSGAISSIKFNTKSLTRNILSDIRIRAYWDGNAMPAVDAPIGTFFGNEYKSSDGNLRTLMVGMNLEVGTSLSCYNYFPMPFWTNAKIELYNIGSTDISLDELELQFTPSAVCSYDKNRTGFFTSSNYYEPTDNEKGKNSLIAEVSGAGHMVYGTITGYNIGAGCEGDLRVFIDGKKSPSIESDGTESWGSWGWGFVTPPQSHAFSSYNGEWNSNANWSQTRLTMGDSFFFGRSLRVELEHGTVNQGMGQHSGQIFYYLLPKPKGETVLLETDKLDLSVAADLISHHYKVDGTYSTNSLTSTYANGLPSQSPSITANVHSGFTGDISFAVKVDPHNSGVILLRQSSQEKQGGQCADVYVDGVHVTECLWLYPNYNHICKWLDDEFFIPSNYTKDKSSVNITISPKTMNGSVNWTESKYTVLSLVYNGRTPERHEPEK